MPAPPSSPTAVEVCTRYARESPSAAWAAHREAARPRERVRVRAKKETRILMQWEEKLFWNSRGFRVVLYIEIVCLEHGLLSKGRQRRLGLRFGKMIFGITGRDESPRLTWSHAGHDGATLAQRSSCGFV